MLILCAPTLVFNPHAVLRAHLSAGTSDLERVFGEMDGALDRGSSVARAANTDRIMPIMHRVISSARLAGYQHGQAVTKVKMPVLYGHTISKAANQRAKKVNTFMVGSTKRMLHQTPDSDYVLSRDRAEAAVRFEASRSFFQGVSDAFRGSGYLKQWLTSQGNSCDECSASEDEGPVEFDFVYDHGEAFPSLHLSCNCFLTAVHG